MPKYVSNKQKKRAKNRGGKSTRDIWIMVGIVAAFVVLIVVAVALGGGGGSSAGTGGGAKPPIHPGSGCC